MSIADRRSLVHQPSCSKANESHARCFQQQRLPGRCACKHRKIRRVNPAGATHKMRGSGVRSLFCRVPRRLPIAAGTITRFSRDARAVEKHPGGRWTHVQRPLCSYRPRARTPDRHSGDAGATPADCTNFLETQRYGGGRQAMHRSPKPAHVGAIPTRRAIFFQGSLD